MKTDDGFWHILVDIVGETENGWRCDRGDGSGPFILPKQKSVIWRDVPSVGAKKASVSVPDGLASKHRQIVGDEAFEAAKAKR